MRLPRLVLVRLRRLPGVVPQKVLVLALLHRKKEETEIAKAKPVVGGGNAGGWGRMSKGEELEEGKGRFGWGALKDLVVPC